MTDLDLASRRSLLQAAAAGCATLACATAGAATTSGAKAGELYVVAELIAKPESADALRALLVPFAAKARKEPGCHEYVLMEVEKEPGRFLTWERWSGHPALDQHMKTPDMAAIGPKLVPILAKPFTQTFLSTPKTA